MIFLPKTSYIHCIYVVLANPTVKLSAQLALPPTTSYKQFAHKSEAQKSRESGTRGQFICWQIQPQTHTYTFLPPTHHVLQDVNVEI